MKKLNVGILFGGKSAEHEVSIASARSIYDALDKDIYNPVLIYIKGDGKWVIDEDLGYLLNDKKNINSEGDIYVTLAMGGGGTLINMNSGKTEINIDVFFPILHGTFGEDGTVQGLLKLADVPFTGASVLGSAVGMDKSIMKKILREARIPIANFITLNSIDKNLSFNDVAKELGTPFFVKPSNMGSSVGVCKVSTEGDYKKAVQTAFLYDSTALIEEFIDGREIECSILGNSSPKASLLGEIIPSHEFYSYDAKYIDSDGAKLIIPAEIEEDIAINIQKMAVLVFNSLYCEGFARIDFFLKKNGDIIVNEINTIPGFTKISMYPKLWEASGLDYSSLITEIINLGVERHKNEKKLKTNYL